jgi:hypothetical protein
VGKASSAKKVARVAKTGGKVKVKSQRGSVFPVAMASVLILGLAMVVWQRSERRGNVDTTAPSAAAQDHWHAAYGFYICDKFLDPLPDTGLDPLGIHTHGDGVAHVHPFTSRAGGRNAKLGRFFDNELVDMSNDKLNLPDIGDDKRVWSNGDKCPPGDGGKAAKLKVKVWTSRTDAEPKTYTSGFNDIRFEADQMLITIAVVADGVDIPKPASEGELDKLTDLGTTPAPSDGTATTVVGATTVAGATTVVGETTVAGATTVATATTTATATTVATTTATATTVATATTKA